MTLSQDFHYAIFGLGTGELVIILLIVLLLFGAKKLPEIGGAIGKSIKNFKSASQEAAKEVDITPKAIENREQAETVEVATKDKEEA